MRIPGVSLGCRGLRSWAHVLLLAATLAALRSGEAAGPALRPGEMARVGDYRATLTVLETLPYVQNDYTRRFRFDAHDNPKLAELRARYRLDQVVAAGRDEFERQVLLMDWTHQQFKKFGQPSVNARGGLEILKGIEDGHTFFCSQYAQLLVSAAASLGWIDRPLALRRHQGVGKVGGSTEHSVTEIWSNQHRKWVMLDPTSNLYLTTNGVPLNAYEIRQEWFYRDGTNLTFVIGKEHRKYRKAELPVFLKRFEGFGDLALHPDELDKYGFIGYIPNTDLMDSGFDYGRMFIVKDGMCDGTKWHVRDYPANPSGDPYFPLGQAALALSASSERSAITVQVQTFTPNLARLQRRFDDGPWQSTEEAFDWKLKPGRNRLEVRTVNRFGVEGPASSAEFQVAP